MFAALEMTGDEMSTHSIDGREWARTDQTKAGSLLLADGGFHGCIKEGEVLKVGEDDAGLYVPCGHGNHYLDGQENYDATHYVGLWPVV